MTSFTILYDAMLAAQGEDVIEAVLVYVPRPIAPV
jgi:hypothetical protein